MSFALLRLLAAHSRRAMLAASAAALVSGLAMAALLQLFGASLAAAPAARGLWFLGLCGVIGAGKLACQLALVDAAWALVTGLRARLSAQVLQAPSLEAETLERSGLAAVLTHDLGELAQTLPRLSGVLQDVVVVVACLGHLIWLWPPMAGVLLGVGAVAALTYRPLMAGAQRLFLEVRKDTSTLFGSLRAAVRGAKQLKLHRGRREAFVAAELEAPGASLRDRMRRALGRYSVAEAWSQALFLALLGLFAYRGAAAIVLPLIFVYGPLKRALWSISELAYASACLTRVEALSASVRQLRAEARGAARPASAQVTELSLRGGAFARDDGRGFSLREIDLTVRAGEVVFLVGGNGSGKSTLMKVLIGLYPLSAGRLLLDGTELTEENRGWYREHFSVVFADHHLFPTLPVEGAAAEAEANRWLDRLKLPHVRVRNGRFGTTDLSHGQRKRLALVSALLEDRPVYVLDEWTAEQDPAFKAFFYEALVPELRQRGKAVLVITHDDRYFHVADRVVKLEAGRLVAQGSEDPEPRLRAVSGHPNRAR